MIESAIIFAKDSGEALIATQIGDTDPNSDAFSDYIKEIRTVASKLEKGVFKLELEDQLIAQINVQKGISVTFIFKGTITDKIYSQWESVAKEIASGFEKIYDPNHFDIVKISEFKKSMLEIIEWHKKELSPIDKMKDALW
jgi:hypothetical protein